MRRAEKTSLSFSPRRESSQQSTRQKERWRRGKCKWHEHPCPRLVSALFRSWLPSTRFRLNKKKSTPRILFLPEADVSGRKREARTRNIFAFSNREIWQEATRWATMLMKFTGISGSSHFKPFNSVIVLISADESFFFLMDTIVTGSDSNDEVNLTSSTELSFQLTVSSSFTLKFSDFLSECPSTHWHRSM